ncbi:MAG: efflux RND transporter permease subunit [Woeseiaceae bacterium]
MNSRSTFAARFLWDYRYLLGALVLLVTLVAGLKLAALSVSNSLEIWYPESDPELINYRQFLETYGSDEIIVVAVYSDVEDRFVGDEGNYLIGDLTDRLLDIDGVANVTSLVTVPESLAEARGRLLSADGKTTALIVQTMVGEGVEERRHQLLLDIRNAIDEFDLEGHLGGYGVVFDGLNEASTTGAAALIVYAHVLMVMLLFVFLRHWVPVIITLFAVGIAAAWTMALYTAAGHQLNMITMVLPTLVLVIGIADCIHILRSVAQQDSELVQSERVIAGVAEIIGPCFLTTITTAAGFLGLTASGMPVVQQLGWFGAAGMLAAFIVSMIVLTMALAWRRAEPAAKRSALDTVAIRLFAFATSRAKSVALAYGVLAVIAGYGITRLNSDTDSIGYLQKTHEVRRDSDFIEREIGAYVPIEFTVSTAGNILIADNLDAIWSWQEAVGEMPEIHWSWSLISAFGLSPGEQPSSVGIDPLLQQYERMQAFSPVVLKSMIAGNNELRISFGAPIMSAAEVRRLIDTITAAANLPDNLHLRPAGYSPLYTRIVDEIVGSQVRGFGAAIILIAVFLSVAMRSWRRVFLALPANALPVAMTLGIMGLTGIPLDVASATIASVILGLVVDDSVHMLRPARNAGIEGSLKIAAGNAGGTLLMTSLVLAAGFLVLGLAEIRSIAWFGVLTSFAVIVAILTDLLLLPALVRLFSAKSESTK